MKEHDPAAAAFAAVAEDVSKLSAETIRGAADALAVGRADLAAVILWLGGQALYWRTRTEVK